MRFVLQVVLAITAIAAEPRALFNGKDLSGWVQEGPRATFAVHEGELRTSGLANQPVWLHTAEEYENFRLSFEYKLSQWAEAAVIVRAPRMGRPMQSGIAIFLAHDFHENLTSHVTGAIAGVAAPSKRLPTNWGAWHSAVIEVRAERLRVNIDGTPVQDVDIASHPELRWRLKRGFIGFPDLGYAYAVRNVRLQDLGDSTTFVELFDGQSLHGWELRGGAEWSVREGSIFASGGHGILYAPPVFTDCEFTAVIRTHDRANGGVFFRGSPDVKEYRGFEVQVYSPVDSVYPTGSIYGKQRSTLSADLEGQWMLLQVRLTGSRIVVRVNGETVATYEGLTGRDLQPGRIGLQMHMDDTSIEYRDLRVRRLER
jgi:hypothetical protein